MKNISINTIAKKLGIRKERVLYKIEQLGLRVFENEYLQKADVFTLLKTYVHSKKTSSNTKSKALSLLDALQSNTLSPTNTAYTQRTKRAIKGKPTQSNTKGMRTQNWYNEWMHTCIHLVQAILLSLQNLVHATLDTCVRFLESMHFKFVAIMVSTCVQMHHSAHWFHRVTPENANWYTAYGYAFMVDLFILVVTLEGRVGIAKTFAFLCLSLISSISNFGYSLTILYKLIPMAFLVS